MPIYEYECIACGKCFEVLHPVSDQDPQRECPECGSREVRRLMSSASLVRSPSQQSMDRHKDLAKVDPTNPRDVAAHFKEHGSRFGDSGFRGKKAWRDAVDRVSRGGPTLENKKD